MSDELPQHIPIDMAVAPDKKPYSHTHVIHTNTEKKSKLAQHSLSPEKLGVVGYVKDVAGFIKDAIEERQEKRKSVGRRNSLSSIQVSEDTRPEERERRRSSSEVQDRTLSDAVTGLFPGVAGMHDSTHVGCTHADDLRDQMMRMNEQENEHKLI
ncbi:hypothetical protein BDB01DRAFT_612315 [Pilobolus umbonatus]|nr:hypothetical protein BDB01DRAFT_612315 [Pilobolus umbonatus]